VNPAPRGEEQILPLVIFILLLSLQGVLQSSIVLSLLDNVIAAC